MRILLPYGRRAGFAAERVNMRKSTVPHFEDKVHYRGCRVE
jgi:hypothetical protein